MPQKVVGKPLNGLLYQPQDEIETTIYGDVVCRRAVANYATHKQFLPAIQSRHPILTLCALQRISVRQRALNGARCDVELYYEQVEVPESTPVPEDEVSESGSTVEVDIRSHPGFPDRYPESRPGGWVEGMGSNFVQYWDADKLSFKVDSATPEYLRGLSKYVVGSGEVAVTKFTKIRPSSVRPLIGRISDPGHGLGSEDQWLILTGGISKRVAYWGRTLVYKYSATPWPVKVYGNKVSS